MIKRVVKKTSLKDSDGARRDLECWLSRAPEKRVAAVEFLRKRHDGDYSGRLQRVTRVVQCSSG